MVHIEEEYNFGEEINLEELLESLLLETRNNLDIKLECDVELLIVDEVGIKNINKITRNIDSVTDVLSFPYIEFNEAGILPDTELDFEPDTDELLLGQIVICGPVALKQAKEYNHTIKREIAFLMTHSLLHLFGFDHMNKEDEEIMCKKQEEILTKLKITRD